MNVIQGSPRSAATKRSPAPSATVPWVAALCTGLLSITSCRQTPSAAPAPAGDAKDSAAAEAPGVTLKPDEIDKMGVKTTPAAASLQAPESIGFGLVIAREAIAQAIADLSTATAAERQSRAALARARAWPAHPASRPSRHRKRPSVRRPSITRRLCLPSGACPRPLVEMHRGKTTTAAPSWQRLRAARASSRA